MSISSINAQNFYSEIAKHKLVFTVRDKEGFPAPVNKEGKRAQPFWSQRSRAEKVIEEVTVYKNFDIKEISLEDFLEKWLPGLATDGYLVALNISGR